MTGTITKEVFNDEVDALVKKSNVVGDGWEVQFTLENKYACKKTIQPAERDGVFKGDREAIDVELQDMPDADKASVKSEIKKVLSFEYHIVYSESYSVPVLYFNAYTASGGLLPLDEIWELVPRYYSSRLIQDKWTFITQVEHPYLCRPFFQLHPCNTEKLMSALPNSDCKASVSDSYLIRWLSTVGPVIRLKVPLEYGRSVKEPST